MADIVLDSEVFSNLGSGCSEKVAGAVRMFFSNLGSGCLETVTGAVRNVKYERGKFAEYFGHTCLKGTCVRVKFA